MNSKINILRGEEMSRRFDFRVICTNPSAISEIEENKSKELYDAFKKVIESSASSEEDLKMKLEKLDSDFRYSWQDMREVRANALLKHYIKELGIQSKFNDGFVDALAVGEEIYQCDIVSGEPTFERINPLKIRIFQSGYSNKIEDADVVVLEDYWSPGKIIDYFYDSLKPADIKYIETLPNISDETEMDNRDERNFFVKRDDISSIGDGVVIDNYLLFAGGESGNGMFDSDGNIKVLRVYWKSRRKIKRVKSYDPETGEEMFDFYPETYVLDEAKGEEEEIYWINEAWEGTKIGKDIYLNMRPRKIQYNRLSNPSRCHFGIIGSLYSLNESKPYSLVDMMKPYNYLYDAIHDRLNKAIASNWGKIITVDLAKVPKGWDMEKWLHYAKINKIAVIDSFKEGNIGAATGKLAGGLNNASSGVIDAETGNYIQQQINLLEFIKMEMSDVAGIAR